MSGSSGSGPYSEQNVEGNRQQFYFIQNPTEQIHPHGMDALVNLLMSVGFSVATILLAIGYLNSAEIAELSRIDYSKLKDLLTFAPYATGMLAALFLINFVRYSRQK